MKGITDTEIIVANSAATTGIFATTGDPLNAGIRAYFDMVNAGGGIDGRRLVFLHEDDAYEPSRARAALHRFMQERKVFAYVGHFGAPAVQATLADIHASGMPVVLPQVSGNYIRKRQRRQWTAPVVSQSSPSISPKAG